MPTKHVVITGKVQGVFYRVSTKEKADQLGITGWVKNTAGGGVEAMATGSEVQLNEFIQWCQKGPSNAVVTNVTANDREETTFERFTIIR